MIKRFFSPPVFENDDDNFRARFINGFAWTVIALLGFSLIPYFKESAVDDTPIVLSGLILAAIATLVLLRRKQILVSGLTIIVLGWIGLAYQAYAADGVKDVVIVAYVALGLLASIVINLRAGVIVIFASIGMIWALELLETTGYISPHIQDPFGYARDLSLIFVAIAFLINLSTKSLSDAISRVHKSEESLRITNQSLQELNQNLENRVANRTAELELANQRNEKRARQFEAIAQVARATASNQDLETLLPNLVDVISRQFSFYHAGIFLLDEIREFAELRAANSEGGRRMLARGHKLGVGQSGIVGFVSATGKPRIALDVGDDAAFFNNPDLPSTHSEMALPLRVADEIIGVLDVQSTTSNAFQEEDIDVLSTLADQVAIAIQNARSYDTTQQLLKEAQRASGSFVGDAWRILQAQEATPIGYRVAENKLTLLAKPLSSALINEAISGKKVAKENGQKATLAIPIRLHDEVIGVMDIQVPHAHEWETDEVDIAQAVAERLSLALESALLLKSTQRRADIERITADISGKIGATTQFDSILRTAAEELSRVLGGSEVLVQLHSEVLEEEV
ncbi:MAG TPA: GAF domain-containing protein [Anaerolineales bacterium]|nr:GAF domain-containing protein [Anaerolineales bacterium]